MNPTQEIVPSVIVSDPEIMSGAVCFSGTRVPVQILFDYLEGGDSIERFLNNYSGVTREQVVAVLEASSTILRSNALSGKKAA